MYIWVTLTLENGVVNATLGGKVSEGAGDRSADWPAEDGIQLGETRVIPTYQIDTPQNQNDYDQLLGAAIEFVGP